MDDDKPALHDELSTMISDLSHTGDLSMLYRMSIADAITALRAARDVAYASALHDAAGAVGRLETGWRDGIIAEYHRNSPEQMKMHAIQSILALHPKTLEQALAGMVQPLVWDTRYYSRKSVMTAGGYELSKMQGGYFCINTPNGEEIDFDTMKAAKAFVQDHHVRRCIAPFKGAGE